MDAAACETPAGTLSLEALVKEHVEFLGRFLRRLGVPPAELEDATQAVFVVAHRHRERIRAGSERSYLIGAAMNVASHLRRAERRRLHFLGRLFRLPAKAPPTPEEEIAEGEARRRLDRLLDALPTDLRAVFVLFELERLSADRIGELLGIPTGTVSSRLRRARVAVKRQAIRMERAG